MGQAFGLVDTKTNRSEFNPSFIERVRRMEFPQLMFIPACPGFVEVDSLLRLDEFQSVFSPNLEPTQLSLGDDVAGFSEASCNSFLLARSDSIYRIARTTAQELARIFTKAERAMISVNRAAHPRYLRRIFSNVLMPVP